MRKISTKTNGDGGIGVTARSKQFQISSAHVSSVTLKIASIDVNDGENITIEDIYGSTPTLTRQAMKMNGRPALGLKNRCR